MHNCFHNSSLFKLRTKTKYDNKDNRSFMMDDAEKKRGRKGRGKRIRGDRGRRKEEEDDGEEEEGEEEK